MIRQYIIQPETKVRSTVHSSLTDVIYTTDFVKTILTVIYPVLFFCDDENYRGLEIIKMSAAD